MERPGLRRLLFVYGMADAQGKTKDALADNQLFLTEQKHGKAHLRRIRHRIADVLFHTSFATAIASSNLSKTSLTA